jgi:hypothetical protein
MEKSMSKLSPEKFFEMKEKVEAATSAKEVKAILKEYGQSSFVPESQALEQSEAEAEAENQALEQANAEEVTLKAMKKSIAGTLGVPVYVHDEESGKTEELVSQDDVDAALDEGAEPIVQIDEPKPPFLVYYDSHSHGKRRYFVDLKDPENKFKPLWTYVKSEAKVIDDPMFAYLVRRWCWRRKYIQATIANVEVC